MRGSRRGQMIEGCGHININDDRLKQRSGWRCWPLFERMTDRMGLHRRGRSTHATPHGQSSPKLRAARCWRNCSTIPPNSSRYGLTRLTCCRYRRQRHQRSAERLIPVGCSRRALDTVCAHVQGCSVGDPEPLDRRGLGRACTRRQNCISGSATAWTRKPRLTQERCYRRTHPALLLSHRAGDRLRTGRRPGRAVLVAGPGGSPRDQGRRIGR